MAEKRGIAWDALPFIYVVLSPQYFSLSIPNFQWHFISLRLVKIISFSSISQSNAKLFNTSLIIFLTYRSCFLDLLTFLPSDPVFLNLLHLQLRYIPMSILTDERTSSSSSSSSSSTRQWVYDVFLSFRGEETRHGFVSHLYKALCDVGFYIFMDNDRLPRGENISAELLKVIELSMVLDWTRQDFWVWEEWSIGITGYF